MTAKLIRWVSFQMKRLRSLGSPGGLIPSSPKTPVKENETTAGAVEPGLTFYTVTQAHDHPTLCAGDTVRMVEDDNLNNWLLRPDLSLHALSDNNDQYVHLKPTDLQNYRIRSARDRIFATKFRFAPPASTAQPQKQLANACAARKPSNLCRQFKQSDGFDSYPAPSYKDLLDSDPRWTTKRVPTEEDSDDDGTVAIASRIGGKAIYMDWHYVHPGTPWMPTQWMPPSSAGPWNPATLDHDGWIRSRLPTEQEWDMDGEVQVPYESLGDIKSSGWQHHTYIVPGQPWAPHYSIPGPYKP